MRCARDDRVFRNIHADPGDSHRLLEALHLLCEKSLDLWQSKYFLSSSSCLRLEWPCDILEFVPSRSMDNQSANPVSLAVDASTSPIQVGIPSASDWQVLHRVEAQALEGLFSATENWAVPPSEPTPAPTSTSPVAFSSTVILISFKFASGVSIILLFTS